MNSLVQKALDDGKILIGYTCSMVPETMLSVGNLLPIRVRAPKVAGTESADIYMGSTACSYVRSILEYAMDDQYDFIKGWVFVASCDHLRRLHDNLGHVMNPGFNHILDVPHKTTPAAMDWLVKEFETLRQSLEEYFGVSLDDTALKTAISEQNEFTRLLTDIADLRKDPDPPFTGTQFQELMLAVSSCPRELLMDDIKKFKADVTAQNKKIDHRARVMVQGGNINDPGFLKVIESQGALVVADRVCTGSIPGLSLIDETKDPLLALAEHNMKKADCPRMMDFDGRLRRSLDAIDAYKVDGVILEHVKFCDTWGLETTEMAKSLRAKGIPVLRLEREYQLSGEGQIRTRVQAFLESMNK
jgi:benzoyl-CoA reductase/2-hydroxyglutaryl-CoA dehydratase subunit BcrC/BadD/HgdB